MIKPDTGHRLPRVMGDLAVQMQAPWDSVATLRVIVEAAADMVPEACWAGISLIQDRQVVAKVPTDPIVAQLDELHSELGEGPA